ncbi:MAG TPA: trehalose-phosphatase [Nitrospiraceae bacterium]|nr:trehalose-phosphatase [Nitrospiraceae bacterium]
MTYLLAEDGRLALRALTTRPFLYAFDFDGTLAPISPDRDAVTIPRSVYEGIIELSKRVPCAVVSGRALADLARRIDGMVPHMIGNHGIESPLASMGNLRAAEEICATWKRDIANRLAERLKSLGGEVEDKRYSLTIHYRPRAQESALRVAVVTLLQQLTPIPHLITGKSSVNALPPGHGGKGPAVLALMRHLRQTGLFFIGDDETDETVFELPEDLVIGVRIGQLTESRARFYLNDQMEIEKVIRLLVSDIDPTAQFPDADKRETSQ